MDPIQLMPWWSYGFFVLGVGFAVRAILKREKRGDDQVTKIDLHS